jgi:sulfur-carrier protein
MTAGEGVTATAGRARRQPNAGIGPEGVELPAISGPDGEDGDDPRVEVTVRYFAAARAAVGVAEERLTVAVVPDVSTGSADLGVDPDRQQATVTVQAVLDTAIRRHGRRLTAVLRRCSFLLDEVAVHGRDATVRDGQILDVLPPFAGG